MILELSRKNFLAVIFMYGIALENLYAPKTPLKRALKKHIFLP